MAWYLNRALTMFREAVNDSYPSRDKESDGTIGDPAHASRTSDHNPDPAGEPDAGSVDAWDMDVEVNGRGNTYAADVEALKRVFEAHESSSYWIHNDRIARRSGGWVPLSYAYAGEDRNRHTQHVHFNTRESHEASTKPWIIQEDDMTPAQATMLETIHWIIASGMIKPDGSGTRVPLQVWGAGIDAGLDAIAARVGLTQDQLNQVKAAAAAGAQQAISAVDWAALIPDADAQEVVDLLAARLAA